MELAQAAEAAGFDSIWTVEHVVVPAQYQSKYPYSPSGKMGSGLEDFPIPDPLIWLAYIASATSTPLFRRTSGTAWGQIRTAFERALDRAKIAGFRFHDLRQTAASHLVMRGARLQEVKELLGHADLSMMLRYAHPSPAHLRGRR